MTVLYRSMKLIFSFFLLLLTSVSVYPMSIVVTIPPLVEGVEAVAPTGSVVTSLIQPGQDPDSTPLNVRQIRQLEHADLIVSTGQMPFEKQLSARISQNQKFKKKLMTVVLKDDVVHHSGDDFHAGVDPHTWVSVGLYQKMITRVSDRLVADNPTQKDILLVRLSKYKDRLSNLKATTDRLLGPKKGRTVLIFHPALGYICSDYGLRQLAIEQHGEASSGRHLIDLVAESKKAGVNSVFTEKGSSNAQAKAIAGQMGVKIVELDLLSPRYISNMNAVVALIAENI